MPTYSSAGQSLKVLSSGSSSAVLAAAQIANILVVPANQYAILHCSCAFGGAPGGAGGYDLFDATSGFYKLWGVEWNATNFRTSDGQMGTWANALFTPDGNGYYVPFSSPQLYVGPGKTVAIRSTPFLAASPRAIFFWTLYSNT